MDFVRLSKVCENDSKISCIQTICIYKSHQHKLEFTNNMSTENNQEIRYVIGTLGESWVDPVEGKTRGKLNVCMEEFSEPDSRKSYEQVNKREHFCDTEKVFITGPFDELERKYEKYQLLKAETTRANKSEGNQQSHVSYYRSVQPVKNHELLEVIFANIDFSKDETSIYLSHVPSTNLVMIATHYNDEDVIVGPFTHTHSLQGDDEVKLTLQFPKTPLPGRKLSDHIVGKLDREQCQDQLIEVTINQRPTTFLADVASFTSKLSNKDFVDIIDAETLLKEYVEPLLKDASFRSTGGKLTKKGLELLKNNVKNGKQFSQDRPRYLKTVDLLSDAAEFDSNMMKLKEELLRLPEGQNFLESYLEKNQIEFYKRYRANELENIETEVSKTRSEVERLEEKRDSLLDELKSIAQQKSEKEDELRLLAEKKRKQLQEEVMQEHKKRNAELQKQILDGENKLQEIKQEYSQYKSLDELLSQINTKRGEYGALNGMIDDHKKSLTNLQSQIKDASAELTENFVKIKAGFEAMTTAKKVSKSNWDFTSQPVDKLDLSNRVKAQQEYLEQLDNALTSHDRHLDKEQLVNLITTIAQTQFTICSGLPGTGKTSLIKRLGLAMGLGNRQHTISVSRGWMSSKDILGYYNGLSESYHPAATGLWEMLLTMQGESDQEVNPAILLLDEMNLSSPEHYFSNFLDLADGESRREIFTGHPEMERLFVPNYMKFVGTINSDETVQPLSPRMLDRAAVIPFDDMISDFSIIPIDNKHITAPINASDWIALFEGKGTPLSGLSQTIFNEIISVLEEDKEGLGQRVLLSYRKRKLVADFVDVAGALLVEYEGAVTALDRAVLQHVLPILSGYGEGFAERLKKLYQVLNKNGLVMSAKRLRKMITEGESSLNSYRYIA
ncbi:hypothetical protein CIK04_12320 [Vibrio sp. 03_296]|nr:hypothetical protein CIK04_12320 [Vibrio sp. 03_296]PJO14063.1 hypothetical protein COO31_005310 [Vibrio vulnificus]